MAKQMYEKKQILKICGMLDRSEDGELIITVEGKDSFEEYSVNDIINDMVGTLVTISNEEAL